ncbi:MAG: glycosyltransferase family 2 protein, partial [Oscillospiraceae bacterium]
MNKNPEISVIVSVYNGEKYLNQCIDALVFQQNFENYEIIIVNKASTDRTPDIIALYEKQYPDKVRGINADYSPNAAMGRNVGVRAAKGDYVCFCDVDDFYELNALQNISEYIAEQESPLDIIIFGINIRNENKIIRRASTAKFTDKVSYLSDNDLITFWRTAIRREYMLSQKEVSSYISDDIGTMPIYICNAKKIGFLNKCLYNYRTSTGISNVKDNRAEFKLEILQCFDQILSDCNESDRELIGSFIAGKFINAYRSAWNIRDKLLEWLMAHRDIVVENKYVKNNASRYKYLCDILKSVPANNIPKIVYLNGFGGRNKKRIKYVKSGAFLADEAEVIVLDQTTCDVSEAPNYKKALAQKEYDYLGHYFALKRIMETGGFYIGNQIEFVASLNSKVRYNAVFSWLDTNSFSDQIFGAKPKADIIAELLRTYEITDYYENCFEPLSHRIKTVFCALFGTMEFTDSPITIKGININPPSIFVIPMQGVQSISRHNF